MQITLRTFSIVLKGYTTLTRKQMRRQPKDTE